jgi:uncharacterized protein with PIN domain
MAGYLFDENLPPDVARGLRLCGYDVYVIGDDPAPPRGSADQTNIDWCRKHNAVLFTTDRGRKDKEILEVLRRYTDASVVFVPEGMNGIEITQNFNKRVADMEDTLSRGKRLRRKITRQGGWQKAD